MRRSLVVPTTLLLSILSLAIAGCGGASPPPPVTATAPDPSGGATPAPVAGGATGMFGLDWGATAEVVRAQNPQATAKPDGGLWAMGMVDNIQALTSFRIGANGLDEIHIEWTSGFISMEDCAETWTKLRAKYDAQLGGSQSDNLAAYWTIPTAAIILACNPNENNAGVLSLTYALPERE